MKRDPKSEEYELVWQAFEDAPPVTSGWSEWSRVSCPLCERDEGKVDKKQSLGLNKTSKIYNCFRCGRKGKLPLWLTGDGIEELIDSLREGVEYELPKAVELPDRFEPLFTSLEESALSPKDFSRYKPHLVFARDYLVEHRGLDPEALFEAGVGAAAFGKFRERVIVPVFDPENPLYRPWRGWISRKATREKVSDAYRNARGMDRTGLLYNQQALWLSTETPVAVVEGTLDALALWPDAVAVLGKPLDSQVHLLAKAPRPVAVILDGDAWREGWALAMSLRVLGQKRAGAIRLPPGLDPDECELTDLQQAMAEAIASPRGWVQY